MNTWKPLDSIGLYCDKKLIRTTSQMMVTNDKIIVDSKSPATILLPKEAVGFCYAAHVGLIHVGFTRDFLARQFSSPTQYDYCVAFNFRDIPKLEIQAVT